MTDNNKSERPVDVVIPEVRWNGRTIMQRRMLHERSGEKNKEDNRDISGQRLGYWKKTKRERKMVGYGYII